MVGIREDILTEIANERLYQEEKWGNTTDDTVNTPNDFVSYISAYATRWFPGGFTPYTAETVEAFKKSMVKVAAIAVAAAESVERQHKENGKTFYEESKSEIV